MRAQVNPNPNLDRPAAGLLKRMRQLQHLRLAKRGPKNLQPNGQLPVNLAARHRNSRNPRERACNRINISQIHLQRIVRPLAQLERRHRRSRRHNRIHLRKRLAKVLRNQRPNFLRPSNSKHRNSRPTAHTFPARFAASPRRQTRHRVSCDTSQQGIAR